MNKKTKKGLIITLSVIFVFFAFLLILPFAFKGKIIEVAKQEVNKMLNAEVNFKDVRMSFIRNFPNAYIGIEDLSISGIGDFEKDTLLYSEKVHLVINLKSLFSDTGFELKKIGFDNPSVTAHILADGRANWDIMKTDSITIEADTVDMSFNLQLKNVYFNNGYIVYQDDEGDMRAVLENVSFKMSGDLSADSSLLKTQITTGSLSFWMEGIPYLSKATAEVKANINANLNDMIFSFSDNESWLNAIPFSFSGWFQMLDPEGFDMDIDLIADKIDFKSILSLIPAMYMTDFDGLKADGKVNLEGKIKGKMIDEDFPAFKFGLNVENGWFQYPDLPKSLKDINIAMLINSPGSTMDSMIIDISKFAFNMDGNPFSLQLYMTPMMPDPYLKLLAKGKLNLGTVKDFYPLGDDNTLSGIFNIDLNLAGNMSYYEKNQFDKFTFGGNMSISDLVLKMQDLPQDVSISKANLSFNNRYVNLSAFDLKIGENDIQATGRLENFVAYAFNDKTLKGQLNLTSSYLNVSDFMSSETEEATTEEEALSLIEVPKNIDFTMQADFKKILFDKMVFENAKGVLKVADGEVKFENMGLQAFGGTMSLNGLYSTADIEKPKLNLNLGINNVVFTEIFSQVETLQKLVPVLGKATGTFSTNLTLSTLLLQNMTPDLNSILANGTLSTQSVDLKGIEALDALAGALKKPELSSLSIKDLLLKFAIKDGRVNTEPFDIKLGTTKMTLGGSSGLDQTLAYTGKIQLPDNLNAGRFSTIGFSIGGTATKPEVKLDLGETISSIVEDSKEALKEEVDKQVEKVKDAVDAEVQKQKEAAAQELQKQADKLRTEAKSAGEKLVQEAGKQGQELVNKASNPLTKKAAELSAEKLVEEAEKKATELYNAADNEAKKIEAKKNEL